MRLSLVAISILIIILTIDLRIKVFFEYDILKNIGRLKLKLFGITVFSGEFSVVGEYFNLIRGNKKVIQIKINLTNNNLKFLKKIVSFYLQKIYVLAIKSDIYISGSNPFLVTMIAGSAKSFGGVFDTNMLAKHQYTDTKTNVLFAFNDNCFKINIYSHIMLNIFDFLWSIITVLYIRSVNKNERKKYC